MTGLFSETVNIFYYDDIDDRIFQTRLLHVLDRILWSAVVTLTILDNISLSSDNKTGLLCYTDRIVRGLYTQLELRWQETTCLSDVTKSSCNKTGKQNGHWMYKRSLTPLDCSHLDKIHLFLWSKHLLRPWCMMTRHLLCEIKEQKT